MANGSAVAEPSFHEVRTLKALRPKVANRHAAHVAFPGFHRRLIPMRRLHVLLVSVAFIAASAGTMAQPARDNHKSAIVFEPLGSAGSGIGVAVLKEKRPLTSAEVATAVRECIYLRTGGATIVPEQVSEQVLAVILRAEADARAKAEQAPLIEDQSDWVDWILRKAKTPVPRVVVVLGLALFAPERLVGDRQGRNDQRMAMIAVEQLACQWIIKSITIEPAPISVK